MGIYLNKISYEDRLVNLGILLGNNNPDQNTTLPTNRDALTILQGNSSTNDEGDDIPEFELNKIYVTLWFENELPTWYLGYCISKNDDNSYRIEDLERVKKPSNLKWKNPRVPDTADIMAENLFECNIAGRLGHFKRKISYFYPDKSRANRKFC